MTPSSEWGQKQPGGRKSPSPWGIAQLAIQKEAYGRETMRNGLLKLWREWAIDRGLCWARDRWGRQQVEITEAVIWQEQEVTETAKILGLMTREPKKTFHEMIVAIAGCLSEIASSNDGEDGEDENDEETEQGKLSEDDESGWVMGTISKTVQHCIQRFWQKHMTLHQLTQPWCRDAADWFREWDKNYGTAELRVPAVIKLQTDQNVAAPALTTSGEHMECLDIVPGRSQMPQGTCQQTRSHMMLGSGKPQSDACIPGRAPATKLDSSPMQNVNPIEPVSIYPCI